MKSVAVPAPIADEMQQMARLNDTPAQERPAAREITDVP
jgi:hypothetical protein